jgi:hypothetical protein
MTQGRCGGRKLLVECLALEGYDQLEKKGWIEIFFKEDLFR